MGDVVSEFARTKAQTLFSILGREARRPPLTTRVAAALADVARAEGRKSDAIRLIEIATMLAERDYEQQERLRADLAAFGVVEASVEGRHSIVE